MATIDERVKAGAAFLDENYPGWLDRINLDELHMDSCDACIIGQVAGCYRKVYPYLDSVHDTEAGTAEAASLGFAIDATDYTDRWPLLADAWRRHITARREANAAGPDWDGLPRTNRPDEGVVTIEVDGRNRQAVPVRSLLDADELAEVDEEKARDR